MKNRETREVVRFIIKALIYLICFIMCINLIMPHYVIICIVVASILNYIVDEIPALDPDELLYEKLRQDPWKMFQEASAKAQEENRKRHEEEAKIYEDINK